VITVVSRRTAGPVAPDALRVYIGRPSPLGNPFVIGRDGTREEVIEAYRRRFSIGVELDEAVQNAVAGLLEIARDGDLELECWCSPQHCHGDVIKSWLEGAIA
jgi:hypothetical protein